MTGSTAPTRRRLDHKIQSIVTYLQTVGFGRMNDINAYILLTALKISDTVRHHQRVSRTFDGSNARNGHDVARGLLTMHALDGAECGVAWVEFLDPGISEIQSAELVLTSGSST